MIAAKTALLLAAVLHEASSAACVPYDELNATYPEWREVTDYIADIGPGDLANSSGIPLTGFRQVLRQDRANVHNSLSRDEGDRVDTFFTTVERRELFDSMDVVTWCYEPLDQLSERIRTGTVAGFLEVTVFESRKNPGAYFIHVGTVG